MRNTILIVLVAFAITSCGESRPPSSGPQSDSWQAPELPEKQQELVLDRIVELVRESGHWQDYPLQSLGFDKDRQQWKAEFGDGRPDAGYHVFIADEKSEQIDILLFPPTWTKYERKKPSNKAIKTDSIVASKKYYEGILIKMRYEHVGYGQMLTGYILRTSDPVEFPGDNFVKKCVVDEVQINWLLAEHDIDHYVNKRVRLSGELFGEHTAHHCRKVLLNADGIDEKERSNN